MCIVKSPNLKTKLLICEYLERYPAVTPEHLSDMFCISEWWIKKLFKEEYIIVPSSINKNKSYIAL